MTPQGQPVATWSHFRLMMLISGICFLLAAIVWAFGADLGPPLAWVAGGFSAWVLASVVP